MDRHRGDRGGERQRGPSRWSDGPPANQRHPSHSQSRGGGDGGFDNGGRHHPYRGGGRGGEPDYSLSGRGGGGGGSNGGGRHHSYRGGGGPHDYSSGGGRGFEGSGRHHPYRGGGDGPPDYSLGGGGGVGGPSFRHGADGFVGHGLHVPVGGAQRRSGGFSPYDRGGSPENIESSNFAKLFIGSVPRTATEEDIRPLFEEHGNVIEVALIKDRRTGQQQGCCFVKYATLAEADRAIRALHNEITLPGGHAPIQVRYADGERERLGAVEYKLFIGSLNKQASEKEIGEIFAPYGHVEDVYIMKDDMKQSRGCGFVKFSHRDMASAAIEGLNGKYTMRGCDQPLTVRFADPKKPRPGESRGGPSFGSPGYGPRSQPPSGPGVWHPSSPRSRGPSDGDAAFKIGAPATSLGFSPSMAQIPHMGQQGMPLQKQVLSPKDPHQSLQAPMGHQVGPMQAHLPGGGPGSLTHSLPGQPVVSMGSQLPTSQPFIQSFGMPGGGQQPWTSTGVPPQLLQHSPTQMMLQQQAQSLQSTFHTTQQAFSQLQQQMQHMQPSQAAKQQSAWGSSGAQQPVSTGPAVATVPSAWASVGVQQPVSTGSAATTVPVSSSAVTTGTSACNWTEHTSPEGYKYYYNSVTKESKWEKPEELSLFEQQQQKLQPVQKSTLSQVQMQVQSQIPTQMLHSGQQHVGQLQQNLGQMQMRQQTQTMQPAMMDMAYGQQQARGHVDAARIQQGLQAAQEWIWKNKPAG